MAEVMPGSWDHRRRPSENSPSGESHQRRNTISSRPGKFANLFDFARPEPSDWPASESEPMRAEQLVEYKPVSSRGLFVRHIIHIKDTDKNSRIHDRIMLVIRAESGSVFTCLTFCAHSEPEVIHDAHCQDHARLISQDEEQEAYREDDPYFKVRITLQYGGGKWKPQKDTYINLRELWHIESADGVEFGVLGQACASSWPCALEKIIDVFASSMRSGPRRTSSGSDSRATLLNPSLNATNEPKDEEVLPRVAQGRRRSVARVTEDVEGAHSDVDSDGAYYKNETTKKAKGPLGRGRKTVIVENDKGKSKSYRTNKLARYWYDKD